MTDDSSLLRIISELAPVFITGGAALLGVWLANYTQRTREMVQRVERSEQRLQDHRLATYSQVQVAMQGVFGHIEATKDDPKAQHPDELQALKILINQSRLIMSDEAYSLANSVHRSLELSDRTKHGEGSLAGMLRNHNIEE